MTGLPELPRLADLSVADRVVAEYVDGAALPAELAPRPFLHRVRTLSGTVVSATCPDDHRWHLGVGVAVQDVAGSNLWGGRTYVRGEGYVWRSDHGTMRHVGFPRRDPGTIVAELDWLDPAGRLLLREVREMHASALPEGTAEGIWQLDLAFSLRGGGEDDLKLGSPATNGRPGGGYGGFFWRLPPLNAVEVRAGEAEGEEAVHGSTAAWFAVSGLAEGRPITLIATQPGRRSPDPWFVRLAAYPGFGVSLAAETPVRVPAGGRVDRRVRVLVADGRPDARTLGEHLSTIGERERIPG